MKNLICKVFGHRESVVWNMNKLTGRFCNRCKRWTSSKQFNGGTRMSDFQRILELRKLASKLNIKIHLVSMDFDKEELEPTRVIDALGIVVVDNVVTNELAFHLQQQRHNDGRAE